ncbi:hypothetical protein ACO22_07920, partial [Paracoccidioides brasiliensis]
IRIVMTDIRQFPAALNGAGTRATSVEGVKDFMNDFECDTLFSVDVDGLECGDEEWGRMSS